MRRVLLLLCLLSASLAAADNVAPVTLLLTGSVPFKLYQGYIIIVEGSIAGRDRLNLMLDTGASPTVIDSGLAHELGITGTDIALVMPNGNVKMQMAEAPGIQLGTLVRTQHKVLLRDLRDMRAHIGIPVHAMIGLDLFANRSFTIDYEHSRLVFGAPELASTVPFETGVPFITLNVGAGRETLRLLIDTGTPGLLLFQSRIHGRGLHLRYQGMTESRNFGGWFRLERVTLEEFRMGSSRLDSMPAVIANDKANWGRTFDGLLGPVALGLKQLSFDFEHRTVGWMR